jgi:hypothetical protein
MRCLLLMYTIHTVMTSRNSIEVYLSDFSETVRLVNSVYSSHTKTV